MILVAALMLLAAAGFLQFSSASQTPRIANRKMDQALIAPTLFAASSNLIVELQKDESFVLNGRNLSQEAQRGDRDPILNLRLRAGNYEVKFLRTGYETQTGRINLTPGKILKLAPKAWKVNTAATSPPPQLGGQP